MYDSLMKTIILFLVGIILFLLAICHLQRVKINELRHNQEFLYNQTNRIFDLECVSPTDFCLEETEKLRNY